MNLVLDFGCFWVFAGFWNGFLCFSWKEDAPRFYDIARSQRYQRYPLFFAIWRKAVQHQWGDAGFQNWQVGWSAAKKESLAGQLYVSVGCRWLPLWWDQGTNGKGVEVSVAGGQRLMRPKVDGIACWTSSFFPTALSKGVQVWFLKSSQSCSTSSHGKHWPYQLVVPPEMVLSCSTTWLRAEAFADATQSQQCRGSGWLRHVAFGRSWIIDDKLGPQQSSTIINDHQRSSTWIFVGSPSYSNLNLELLTSAWPKNHPRFRGWYWGDSLAKLQLWLWPAAAPS